METVNLEQLEDAMRELSISISEVKGLVFSGKVIQADRKLQGSQTKCNTILAYIQDLRKLEDLENVVACKNPKTETPVADETSTG